MGAWCESPVGKDEGISPGRWFPWEWTALGPQAALLCLASTSLGDFSTRATLIHRPQNPPQGRAEVAWALGLQGCPGKLGAL